MKFPQDQFVAAIVASIKNNNLPMPKLLVDAACGNGYTTLKLASYFSNTKFIGVDILSDFLQKNTKNVSFLQKDVHEFFENESELDNICLINALFLLPEPILLLQKIKDKLSTNGIFYLIIPNIEGKNFKRFQKISPETNTFIVSKKEMTQICEKLSFEICETKELVFTPFFNRIDTKFLFFIRHYYLTFLEFFNQKKNNQTPSYFLFVLKSKQTN